MRPSLRALPALTMAGLATSLLVGCSADQISATSATTSRMTKPTDIAEVEDAATASDPPAVDNGAATNDGTQVVDMPEQIWVRSAARAAKTYILTVAAPPDGTFNVYDAHAVGGMTLHEYQDATCTVTKQSPLPTPIKGAIKEVTRLVTLTCPAPSAYALPVLHGSWGDTTKGGSAEAIFALGGPSAQGRPSTPGSHTDVANDDRVDAHVQSVTRHGKTLTVRAWATAYAGLSVSPTETTTTDYGDNQCTTKLLAGEKAGVRTHTPQRFFEVTCANQPTTKGWSLMVTIVEGEVGQSPIGGGKAVELRAGASAP